MNWQLGYDLAEPIKVPKGAKLVVSAYYDNSANNKFNPDPNETEYIGNMTWEEMDTPFFAITVDENVKPSDRRFREARLAALKIAAAWFCIIQFSRET